MNFQVYLDEQLGKQVRQLCEATHKKRNTIIREALKLYLELQGKEVWPSSVLNFRGMEDFPNFEADRGKDKPNVRQGFLD